jgi:hypothetical protein
LVCLADNAQHLRRGMSAKKARAIVTYLDAHGARVQRPHAANDPTTDRPCVFCEDRDTGKPSCIDFACACWRLYSFD